MVLQAEVGLCLTISCLTVRVALVWIIIIPLPWNRANAWSGVIFVWAVQVKSKNFHHPAQGYSRGVCFTDGVFLLKQYTVFDGVFGFWKQNNSFITFYGINTEQYIIHSSLFMA